MSGSSLARAEPAPAPTIHEEIAPDGSRRARLSGRWNLRSTRTHTQELLDHLSRSTVADAHWDLTQIDDLDIAAATLLWRAWGDRRPAKLALRPADERIFERLATLERMHAPPIPARASRLLLAAGETAQSLVRHTIGMLGLIGDLTVCSARLLAHPAEAPWKEISATIYHSGLHSLPIMTLVGFLVGIVLSYLTGEQLHDFGVDSYIVNLMGITSLRELGPLLAAILNAGRSGSSMTAQIGVMRVTSELDAMSVLGISHTQRLVLPRVIGQVIALPLVVLWTDVMALLGGMFGAKLQLGISTHAFIHGLPQVVPLANLWFGLVKGAVFGALIALVACYFGLTIRPDTEGLAAGTTQSVVSALTLVLMADAVFAVMFAHLGL
jgi:phospholipid/cholesterol/gamma-HCH transport system permease protein